MAHENELGYATQCICPCCGFQSGFHDDAMDEPMTIEKYRDLWISEGAKWFSNSRNKLQNWSLKEQIKSKYFDINKNF
ncbi:hypothetical protein M5X05_14445 [Paenibacillus alvei]|nr:hypothetical protein [Paenibacillus alvei]MCY9705402.1 hypothetical protein [Paenibacillus alvei]